MITHTHRSFFSEFKLGSTKKGLVYYFSTKIRRLLSGPMFFYLVRTEIDKF